jgi:heme exporter protein C
LAWWGIAGFALVPVVHFSVLMRSLHQQATVLQPASAPPMDPLMLTALVFCLAGATVSAAWLWLRRLAQLETPAITPHARETVTAS